MHLFVQCPQPFYRSCVIPARSSSDSLLNRPSTSHWACDRGRRGGESRWLTKSGEKTCLLNDALSSSPMETRPIRRAINLISIGVVRSFVRSLLSFFRIASFVTTSRRNNNARSVDVVQVSEGVWKGCVKPRRGNTQLFQTLSET